MPERANIAIHLSRRHRMSVLLYIPLRPGDGERWTCVEISYGRLIQKSSIPAANHVIK
jgi:hypothetical protein